MHIHNEYQIYAIVMYSDSRYHELSAWGCEQFEHSMFHAYIYSSKELAKKEGNANDRSAIHTRTTIGSG